ncbi:hypothetical protein JW933_08535 [candidate division FCPU426 bacterium]|nr:hypothetical protein [candidate division FCPU426 bacterium]
MEDRHPGFYTFIWRVMAAHTIAYGIAGLFALSCMGCREHFSTGTLTHLMRPMDSPWVALGMGLQVLRGSLLGVVLYPFRRIFLEAKHGWWLLAWLIPGLSAWFTIGPAPGSFEGMIYTVFPWQYHLLGLPETLL